MIDDKLKLDLWNERQQVEGLPPEEFRLDPCNALIEWSKYGDNNDKNGWVLDHVIPLSRLKSVPESLYDDKSNLRPMHIKNNAAKGDDYPEYRVCVQFVDGENVECEGVYEVNNGIQETLGELFSDYLV